MDDDGRLTITDAIKLLNYLFGVTFPPPPPFPTPGYDPTPDGMICEE